MPLHSSLGNKAELHLKKRKKKEKGLTETMNLEIPEEAAYLIAISSSVVMPWTGLNHIKIVLKWIWNPCFMSND